MKAAPAPTLNNTVVCVHGSTTLNNITPPASGSETVACYDAIPSVLPASKMPVVTDACGNTLQPVGNPVVNPANFTSCTGQVSFTYTYRDCQGHTHDWVYTYRVINGHIDAANAEPYTNTISVISNQETPVCASVDSTISITVHPNPSVSIATIPTVCPAAGTQPITATITTATTGDYTYQWTGGVVLTPATTTINETSNTVSASVPTICDDSYNIYLTVTDHYGCQATTEAIMVVKDETTPTIAAVNNTVQANTIGNCKYTVPDLTTSNYVTVSDNCTTQSLRVTQTPEAGTLFGTNESSKTVTVTVTDGCGKHAMVDITVQKPDAIQASIAADVDGVCQGASATLTATAISGNEGEQL